MLTVSHFSGSFIWFRTAVCLTAKATHEKYIPEGINGGTNLGLGSSPSVFLYPLGCYQQRQGLKCVILHAILHVCKTGSVTVWNEGI